MTDGVFRDTGTEMDRVDGTEECRGEAGVRRTGRAELIIHRLLLAKVHDLLWEDSGDMAVLDATPMDHCHGKLCSR